MPACMVVRRLAANRCVLAVSLLQFNVGMIDSSSQGGMHAIHASNASPPERSLSKILTSRRVILVLTLSQYGIVVIFRGACHLAHRWPAERSYLRCWSLICSRHVCWFVFSAHHSSPVPTLLIFCSHSPTLSFPSAGVQFSTSLPRPANPNSQRACSFSKNIS
jgi:hypothetical protein